MPSQGMTWSQRLPKFVLLIVSHTLHETLEHPSRAGSCDGAA